MGRCSYKGAELVDLAEFPSPTHPFPLLFCLLSFTQYVWKPSSYHPNGSCPVGACKSAPHRLPSPVTDFQLMYRSGVTSKDRCARRSPSSRRPRGRASRFSSSLSSGFPATHSGSGSSHLRFGVTAGGSTSRTGSRRTRKRWRRSGVPARPTMFGCVVLPSGPRRCTP